jgi:glycine cleavage system aminomethyltransferase T
MYRSDNRFVVYARINAFIGKSHIQQNEKKKKKQTTVVYFVTNARNVDQINEQIFTNKTLKYQRNNFDFIRSFFSYRC